MINKLLLFILVGVLLSFIPNPEKEYSAKLSINEWQTLIANQDDVAPNARRAVIQKVISQIQPQIQADTTKKK